MSTATIGFIGGGNMAASIIGGLLTSGVDARQLRAGDPSQESLDRLASLGPITTSQDNLDIIPGCDVLVMAVKPQLMKVVCAGIADTVQASKPLIISIAAGVTSDSPVINSPVAKRRR